MRATDTAARRAEPAAARDENPRRWRLGKREWKDIRHARKLGDDSSLHAVEIHGVRLTFRWALAQQTTLETSGTKAASAPGTAADERTASAQSARPQPPRPANARERRSAERLQAFMRQWEAKKAVAAEVAARGEAPGATGSKRDSRVRKPDAGAPATAISAAATRGGSPPDKGCEYGTLRQQALAGIPAKDVLQSLPSGGESSSEAQLTSDADDAMSEASAVVPTAGHAKVAKGRGRGPPHTPGEPRWVQEPEGDFTWRLP